MILDAVKLGFVVSSRNLQGNLGHKTHEIFTFEGGETDAQEGRASWLSSLRPLEVLTYLLFT